MTRSRVSSRVFLPAPVRGLDFRIPIFNMPEEYSPFMVNFMAENGKLYKRNGHTQTILLSTNPGEQVSILIPYIGAAGFTEICVGRVKTATASTEVNTPTDILAPNHDWHIFKDSIYIAANNGVVYNLNPSTLVFTAALTYTQTSAAEQRKPITSYRERLYVGDKFNLYYGGVGAVAGAMTAFSVQNLMNGDGIIGLETFTITEGFNTQHYLVLVSSVGEVLIYAGTFPGASDWNLVTKFQVFIPTLSSVNNPTIETFQIPNDVIINAKFGHQFYSIRQLLVDGLLSASFSFMEPIRPYLEAYLVATSAVSGQISIRKSACYWPQKNSIVVAVENLNSSGGPDLWNGWVSTLGVASLTRHTQLFLIDIGTGVCTLHSSTAGQSTIHRPTSGQLRSNGHYVGMPDDSRAYKLFDSKNTTYIDFGGGSPFKSLVLLSPARTAGYRNKSIKNLLMYSNFTSTHSLQHGISKNFDTSPPNLTTFTTANTSTKTHIDVMPGSQIGNGVVTTLLESSANVTPFTFYGMDMILEDGGEY